MEVMTDVMSTAHQAKGNPVNSFTIATRSSVLILTADDEQTARQWVLGVQSVLDFSAQAGRVWGVLYLPGYCSVRSRPCGAAYRLWVVCSAGGSERARPPRGGSTGAAASRQ